MMKAVFLDRDGTIIIDKNYLNDPEGVELLPNASTGLLSLQQQGYLLIVVTNQSGVAKGIVSESNIHLIHQRIDQLLAHQNIKIHAYYYNTADSHEPHSHRKPNPGMLLEAIAQFNIDPQQSWMIGDRASDIVAGHNAKTKTIFINNSAHQLPPALQVDHHAQDLLDAAEYIKRN